MIYDELENMMLKGWGVGENIVGRGEEVGWLKREDGVGFRRKV